MIAISVTRINAGFWAVWTFLLIFTYFNSYDDPSSIFYDESRAYEQHYSRQRATEAHAFLRNIPPKLPPDEANRFLCIGVPSINRTTQSFLPNTVASLLDNLTPQERASIHVVVLLADRPSDHHSAYGQPWLESLADEVLLYGDPPADTKSTVYHTVPFDLVEGRQRGDGRVENMRLDHSLLVEACRNHGSDYFILVEDDIIASRDWFSRTRRGVAYVEAKTAKTKQEWIYLRLFFSELFMGWNNEEWLAYATHIFLVYAAALVVFLLARRRFRLVGVGGGGGGAGKSAHATRYVTALVFGLWLPALIALYFLAGRVSVGRLNPLAWSAHGVREMPQYGCCAQGLLIPKRQLDGVFQLMRYPPYEFPGDMILEGYAGDRGLKKWALDPSVFQHVGFKESSEGPRKAEVWNFSFERLDPKT